MDQTHDVLFEEMPGKQGDLGIITLNRPKALNSLNHVMIHAMYQHLKEWAAAPQIKAVIIRAAEGRAFCAGGDLRLTYDRYLHHDPNLFYFFRDEYQLNRLIFHFPKPYIALLDGITMGGGVGISIHGSHRVATNRLLFAMPETGIGFFPDVGGTYFLPRLPNKIGFYLGLCGTKIASDDCRHLGIATHKIPENKIPELMSALINEPLNKNANETVTRLIDTFDLAPHSSLFEQGHEIEKCFSETTMEKIASALQASSSPICNEAAAEIEKKSPTSLKITLRALLTSQQMTFDACMKQEYRLSQRFLKGHDFMEGIRAVIIDKDQKPMWAPPSLAEVNDREVENYFAPVEEELI